MLMNAPMRTLTSSLLRVKNKFVSVRRWNIRKRWKKVLWFYDSIADEVKKSLI